MARTFKKKTVGTKKPFNKTGSKRSKKGSYRGTSFSANVARPLVNRMLHNSTGYWAQAPGVGLNALQVAVPERTWGQFTRGFDIPQVNSNGIHSRNVTMRVQIQFPKAADAAQPYQLRIVQCWIKSSIEAALTSTVGTSGMYDGIVLNFDPNTAWEARASQVFGDSIGNELGDGRTTGNISSDRVKVISDTTRSFTAAVTDPAGKYVYPTYDRTFNFKTGQFMKLYPSTAGAAIPADPLNIKMVPVNQQRVWIPCIAMMVLNGGDYQGESDRPHISLTESHYWTNQ